jgi:hypothetical protein
MIAPGAATPTMRLKFDLASRVRVFLPKALPQPITGRDTLTRKRDVWRGSSLSQGLPAKCEEFELTIGEQLGRKIISHVYEYNRIFVCLASSHLETLYT